MYGLHIAPFLQDLRADSGAVPFASILETLGAHLVLLAPPWAPSLPTLTLIWRGGQNNEKTRKTGVPETGVGGMRDEGVAVW